MSEQVLTGMILFATKYDKPTRDCYAMALLLRIRGATLLLGTHATRSNLMATLAAEPEKFLFAMSHGQPEHLVGQHGAPAVDAANASCFTGRVAFAFACHTGSGLGRDICFAGGVWCGFDQRVQAPPTELIQQDIIRKVFLSIIRALPNLRTQADCNKFFTYIQSLCDRAESNLAPRSLRTHGASSGSLQTAGYVVLEDLRNRLRIWHPAANDCNTPLKDPVSKAPMYLV